MVCSFALALLRYVNWANGSSVTFVQILDAKLSMSRREFESKHIRWVQRVARDRAQEKIALTQIHEENVQVL